MTYESISPSIFTLLMNDIISKYVVLLRSMPTNEEMNAWAFDKSDDVNFYNNIGHFNETIKSLNEKSIEYLDNMKI